MKILKEHTFKADIVKEGSFGSFPVGDDVESTMTVYGNEHDVPVMIEWDLPELEETEHIGLEIEGKVVTGYDGVMCMPAEACDLLESMGYDCSEVR